jgi:thiamine-monophosphate kinase
VRADELGEFTLIARLTSGLEARPDVLLGVGDDAAALDLAPGAAHVLVATCDAQVAGSHFLLGFATPEEIGAKALAVNLSDIAAMGAEPLWALVSLTLPPSLDVAVLDGVYAGFRRLARRYGVAVVGGNIAASDGPLVIDVTLLGRAARGALLRRSGGRVGDAVLVTGAIGAAAAGVLLALQTPLPDAVDATLLERARAAQVAPEPRVAEGRALAASGVVTAMLDISDGLAQDLAHLCAASGVGAELEAAALPIDAAATAVAAAYGRSALALALGGGEDYELLFTVAPEHVEQALGAVQDVEGTARVIGRLTAEVGLRLREPDGNVREVEPSGWDHLRHVDS